ncbi:hypothetical protein PT276_05705 [Orbaceae bacterium ESL0721]|nr:hypothetical protein [Orbaceae bacterium ESL0721]
MPAAILSLPTNATALPVPSDAPSAALISLSGSIWLKNCSINERSTALVSSCQSSICDHFWGILISARPSGLNRPINRCPLLIDVMAYLWSL